MIQNNLVFEKFGAKAEDITIICRNNLSHSTEKFRKGTLLYSRKIEYGTISCIRGAYHNSPSKSSCLRALKCFLGELFLFSRKLVCGRSSSIEGRVVTRFSVENFLSQLTETFRKETPRCFYKSRLWKNVMDNRGRVQHNCQSFFLSLSTEAFSRGTIRCFRNFRVWKVFMDEKGGSASHDSQSKFICITAPQLFVGERFRVSKIIGFRKVLWIRW